MTKVVLIIAGVLLSGVVFADPLESQMLFSDEYVGGKVVSEYVNDWWMWAFSMPQSISPIVDKTGKYCSVSQEGDVWFLAGGYGSSKIKRTCTIPKDKYVFFPVINMAYWPKKEGAMKCDKAKALAALNNDHVLDINIQLDSAEVWNPANTRMSSGECFNLLGKLPKKLNAPRLYPSATDGYWVMLKPLSPGRHSLKFSAQYDRKNGAYGTMAQDIEYELTVQ